MRSSWRTSSFWDLAATSGSCKKIAPLRELFEARTQLSNLMTYMDGKTGAEALIAKIIQDPALMKTLAAQPAPQAEGEE